MPTPSALGHMGVKRFPGAKGKPGVAQATIAYIAAIARVIGDITKDPQLMAIGKGLGDRLQQQAGNAPQPTAEVEPPATPGAM